jgi:ribosomal protein S18 acetylase RimI-like enzyme
MTIEIRAVTEADESAIVALWHACGLAVGNSDPLRDFRAVRGRASSEILAAFDGTGQLLGSIAVGYDSSRGWLHYVSVDPQRRGQGTGRALVKAAEEWLAARDVIDVHLTVRGANAEAAQFYERIGYRTLPSIMMEKLLCKRD